MVGVCWDQKRVGEKDAMDGFWLTLFGTGKSTYAIHKILFDQYGQAAAFSF
jgi:hypothetical protein